MVRFTIENAGPMGANEYKAVVADGARVGWTCWNDAPTRLQIVGDHLVIEEASQREFAYMTSGSQEEDGRKEVPAGQIRVVVNISGFQGSIQMGSLQGGLNVEDQIEALNDPVTKVYEFWSEGFGGIRFSPNIDCQVDCILDIQVADRTAKIVSVLP